MNTYAMTMKQAARVYLSELLTQTHGNRTLAAEIAGLHRSHLWKLLSDHQLGADLPDGRAAPRKPVHAHGDDHHETVCLQAASGAAAERAHTEDAASVQAINW